MRRVCERELLHRGAKFDFERVWLEPPGGGEPVAREVVRHPGAVVVLGLTETPAGEPAAVLIRNERFAVGETLWELPAGTLEPGEEPAACAGRELEEETGYRAASVEGLCTFYTTPGMTDEKMHAFVARGLEHVGQRLEEDERIEPRVLGVREVMGLVDGGGLVDGKSLTALLVAARRGVLGG